jgi:hypothetical protein
MGPRSLEHELGGRVRLLLGWVPQLFSLRLVWRGLLGVRRQSLASTGCDRRHHRQASVLDLLLDNYSYHWSTISRSIKKMTRWCTHQRRGSRFLLVTATAVG